MREVALALLIGLLVAGQVAPATARAITLILPRPLQRAEGALLKVALGEVEHRAEVEIADATGATIGVISPYAVHSGNKAGTYLLPVPREMISHDRISLLISMHQDGNPPRAPTMNEVKSVRIEIVPRPKR